VLRPAPRWGEEFIPCELAATAAAEVAKGGAIVRGRGKVVLARLVIGVLLGRGRDHDDRHRGRGGPRIPPLLVRGTLMRYIGPPPRSMAPLAPSTRSATAGRASVPSPGLSHALGPGLRPALRPAVAITPIAVLADLYRLPTAGAVETAVALDFPNDPDLPPRGTGRAKSGACYTGGGPGSRLFSRGEGRSLQRTEPPLRPKSSWPGPSHQSRAFPVSPDPRSHPGGNQIHPGAYRRREQEAEEPERGAALSTGITRESQPPSIATNTGNHRNQSAVHRWVRPSFIFMICASGA